MAISRTVLGGGVSAVLSRRALARRLDVVGRSRLDRVMRRVAG